LQAMIPLALAAGVAPRQQQGKGGSPNGGGSYNTGSAGRLAPLSAAPLPPLPLAFTADSASAGTPDATPTSLPPAAPVQQQQQQQAMGGAAARRSKRRAPPPATAAQQAPACDSDDGQGSHGSGTAGGTHQFHRQLPPVSAAAARGGQAPGAFLYANPCGAAALLGAGAAGGSPAGPAALPIDLSSLDDLDGGLPAWLPAELPAELLG
jgi:hypothetical protein